MAKIIYKRGMEGQNKLSSIEGIEIDLLNGQKALVYPKYSEKQMLSFKQEAPGVTEIEALKVTETAFTTEYLRDIGSPAAQFVSQFKYGKYRNFYLPSLLAAMEIQHQKEEIDELAETIEGADLLRDFTSYVWSCSRYNAGYFWCASGGGGFAGTHYRTYFYLAVPTILYNE